jgi:hypothetical protein
MDKICRNKYQKQHYHDNIERYRIVKRNEEKRNRKNRQPRERKYRIKRYYENFINTLLTYAKARSKTYSMDFDLDKEYLITLFELQNKKCALTGLEFATAQGENSNKRRPFAPSIDRIDYKKGYTKDNTRLVCVAVNISLSDFGDEVFDKICEARVNYKILLGAHNVKQTK